mgnify:CR=1 FL=1
MTRRAGDAAISADQGELTRDHFPVDQRRDQVTGDDEEHVDTDESALRKAEARVEENDRQDRDGSQAVDVGTVLWHASW